MDASASLESLCSILPDEQQKNHPGLWRGGTRGVQREVQDTCGNAYYIHYYAHQLNLVMQHPTDQSLFPISGEFLPFLPSRAREPQRLMMHQMHRQHAGTNTRLTWWSVLRPSRTDKNLTALRRERLGWCLDSVWITGIIQRFTDSMQVIKEVTCICAQCYLSVNSLCINSL